MSLKICLIIVLIFYSFLYSVQNVVILYDENYPPYCYEENGKPKGVYIDLIMMADLMVDEFDIEFRGIHWKRGLKEIADGKELGIIPPLYYPLKRPYIDPYSVPIFTEILSVFVREGLVDSKIRKWPVDFYGLKVGENAGYLGGREEFYNAVKEGLIIREEAKSTYSNLLKLTRGRIDCYVNDSYTTWYNYKKLKSEGRLFDDNEKIIEVYSISKREAYIGYSKYFMCTWKDDFIIKLDKAISELKESGAVKRILKLYIDDEK